MCVWGEQGLITAECSNHSTSTVLSAACVQIHTSFITVSVTWLYSPLGLELMVKLRTLLTVFIFTLKVEACDYGKGVTFPTTRACGVQPITMHCVSFFFLNIVNIFLTCGSCRIINHRLTTLELMVNLSWKVYVILLKICFSMEKMTGMWTSWSRVLCCIPQIPVREKQLTEMLQLSFELCKAFDHWRIADFLTSPTKKLACQPFARDSPYTEVPSDLKQIKCIRLLLQLAWL